MYGERSLSYFFADCVHKALSELKVFGEINVLVPVPPRPNKIRKKGWDQIAELVSILQKQHGYKVLNLLERVSTFQQKKLNRQERISMQGKNYIVSKKINYYRKNKCLPKEVILIDDVFTTGATVESCSKLLKEIGVNRINVLTLFIVD